MRILIFLLIPLALRLSAADFYVWQRVWTPAVREAAEAEPPENLFLLAAELETDRTVMVKIPEQLKESTAVVRVHVRARNDFSRIASVLEKLPNRKVQIDLDIPESALAEYALTLKKLAERFPERELSATLLPCHMRHTEEMRLIVSSGIRYFVLQLHGLENPADGNDAVLMRESVVKQALSDAKKLNFPFRTALPAYAYVIDGGRVYAEGFPSSRVTAGTRIAAPDAGLLARIVRENPDLKPVWFRLPVKDDRWSLDRATVELLDRGVEPTPETEISFEETGNYATVFLTVKHRIPLLETTEPELPAGERIPLAGCVFNGKKMTVSTGACGRKIPCAVIITPNRGSHP